MSQSKYHIKREKYETFTYVVGTCRIFLPSALSHGTHVLNGYWEYQDYLSKFSEQKALTDKMV